MSLTVALNSARSSLMATGTHRRGLGLREDPVGPVLGRVNLGVGAQAHRDSGDDARSRAARLRRRPC